MTKSNMFKWVVVALTATVLNACVKAEKRQDIDTGNPDPQKRFRFSRSSGGQVDVTGYAENLLTSGDVTIEGIDTTSDVNTGTVTHRQYNLRLCGISDVRARNNSILGAKLKIHSDLALVPRKSANAAVDPTIVHVENNDCIYWAVVVPFNHYADSVNLEVNFVILSMAAPKSYIHKKVLFNPWNRSRGGDNPEFLDITRTVVSDSLRRQPWARGEDDIYKALKGDLVATPKRLEISSVAVTPLQKNRENYVSKNNLGAEANQDFINEADIEIRRSMNRLQPLDLFLNLQLSGLKIRLKNSSGTPFDDSQRMGRYRIQAQIIATDLDTRGYHIITDRKFNAADKIWSTNTMGVSALIPLSVMIRPNWGNLQLALRVESFDVPEAEPFQALYTLGQFSDIGRSQSLSFDLSSYTRSNSPQNLDFDYAKYLASATNYEQWQKGLTEGLIPTEEELRRQCVQKNGSEKNCVPMYGTLERGFPRFRFNLLNVLFSRIMPGDTATDRTIQYTVDTCLVNNVTQSSPGRGLKFEITTEDRGIPFKLIRETDHQGCLRWFGMISHKPYHRENLVRKVSHLKYLGTDLGRQEFDLDYYINPWDEKFTFGRDARALPEEYLMQIDAAQKIAPPTRILITNFNYDAIGFRYVIDKFMNLTVKKSVLMAVEAKILKYNSIIWGRSGLSELRDGIYLLKVAMQKDYLDPTAPGRAISVNKRTGQRRLRTENANDSETKQFLTVKEALVRVLGGKIVTPIEFDVTDLRTLRIRAQLFIQVETIDEKLLRLAVLLDERLTSMMGQNGAERTPQVLNELADQEKIQKELEVARQAADQAQIAALAERLRLSEEKVKSLLKGIDRTTMSRVLSEMARIRSLGETGVSNDRNRQYQAVNSALRTTIQAIQNKIKNKIEAETARSAEDYVQKREQECAQIVKDLKAAGRHEEAQMYDITSSNRADGALCRIDLDKENRFYYLTSTLDIGSDRWLRSILTAEEYAQFQSSSLRDDFTKPYMPNYDFDLLSNQGDEKEKDENGQEWGERVSGLPRRTFIGPVTFVLNGNGSAMRPTDVLDESRCQGTCAVLDESEKSITNNSNFMKDLREKMVRAFGNAVNDAYERSPYFGYVGHFYNKQVEDLIPLFRGVRSQYIQEMEKLSEVGNLVEKMNMQYVSFGDSQEKVRYLDQECYKQWKSQVDATYRRWQNAATEEDREYVIPNLPESCLRESERQVTKQEFVNSINEKKSVSLAMQDLKEFSKNGLMSEKLSLEKKRDVLMGLCTELTAQMVPRNTEELDRHIEKGLHRFAIRATAVPHNRQFILAKVRAIEENCQSLVRTFYSDAKRAIQGINHVKDQNFKIATLARLLPMQVVRNARVLDTSNRYIYRDGKTLNYSVGTSFSLSNSFGVNRGMKFDPLESLEKLSGAVGGRAGDAANKFIGVAGGMVNFAWAQNENVSRSNGTSVSDGTTLSAQISTLDIELSEWEKCVTVRFDAKYYREAIESLVRNDGAAVGYDTKFISGIGYMMCSGDHDKMDDLNEGKQLRVRERYYYLTQIFNEGDMQDPQSLANHPWMLQIRGVRDFAIFQAALKKPERELNWWSMYGYARNDLVSMAQLGADQRHNDRSSMEIVNYEDEAKALQMMKEAYVQSLPTFPGLYQFSDSPDDLVTDWLEVAR